MQWNCAEGLHFSAFHIMYSSSVLPCFHCATLLIHIMYSSSAAVLFCWCPVLHTPQPVWCTRSYSHLSTWYMCTCLPVQCVLGVYSCGLLPSLLFLPCLVVIVPHYLQHVQCMSGITYIQTDEVNFNLIYMKRFHKQI